MEHQSHQKPELNPDQLVDRIRDIWSRLPAPKSRFHMGYLPEGPESEDLFRGKRPLDIRPGAKEYVNGASIDAMPVEWMLYYSGAYLIECVVLMAAGRRYDISTDAWGMIHWWPRMPPEDKLRLVECYGQKTIDLILCLVRDLLIWLTEIGEFNHIQLERWLRER